MVSKRRAEPINTFDARQAVVLGDEAKSSASRVDMKIDGRWSLAYRLWVDAVCDRRGVKDADVRWIVSEERWVGGVDGWRVVCWLGGSARSRVLWAEWREVGGTKKKLDVWIGSGA